MQEGVPHSSFLSDRLQGALLWCRLAWSTLVRFSKSKGNSDHRLSLEWDHVFVMIALVLIQAPTILFGGSRSFETNVE